LHSSGYLQCALVLQHPEAAEKLGGLLADRLRLLASGPIGLVVSPALGGLIIGHEVARALGTRFIFTERDAATRKMTLRRGFAAAPLEHAVVVEDVVTTGGSTRDVVEVLRGAGAEVLAAGSIIDRSGGRAEVGVPRVALATLEVANWVPEECPLCRRGIPAVKPGSRPA
jgi:orotate phosphoribosyltransferase